MFHQSTHQPNEDMPGLSIRRRHAHRPPRHLVEHGQAVPDLPDPLPEHPASGRFHADVCYFYGEGTSKYVPTKRFLKPALPPGYNFDCVNADVLLNRMTVKDGQLVLPDGISYRLLVLPTAANDVARGASEDQEAYRSRCDRARRKAASTPRA